MKKLLVIILIFSCFYQFSTSYNYFGDQEDFKLNTSPMISELVDHDSIFIDGNDDFASQAIAEGWPGNGSKNSPYIISNLNISESPILETSISIRNVNIYFFISNCYIAQSIEDDYDTGISLENVTQCELLQNTIIGDGGQYTYGVIINGSEYVNFSQNIINDYHTGVKVDNSSQIVLSNNIIHCSSGFLLENCNYSTIQMNDINNIDTYHGSCIRIQRSNFNLIIDNNISNGSGGIYLTDSSNNNTITFNNIHHNGYVFFVFSRNGIEIHDSSGNKIIKNTISSNKKQGIYLKNSPNNIIIDNQMTDDLIEISGDTLENHLQTSVLNNTVNGKPIVFWQNEDDKVVPAGVGQVVILNCNTITIQDQELLQIRMVYCQDIFISNNLIHKVYPSNPESRNGVYLEYSSKISISNNTFIGRGIKLEKCTKIEIYRNSIVESYNGIISSRSTLLNILFNVIRNSGHGIIIDWSSHINITGNIIAENSGGEIWTDGLGIRIDHSNTSYISHNLFYKNSGAIHFSPSVNNSVITLNIFIDNQFHDHQVIVVYSINCIFLSNYWSDWTGPDNNDDGFADNPYLIYGWDITPSNQDPFPLVSPPDLNSSFHILLPPRVLFPNGREIINDSITISWSPAYDTMEHLITYAVYYSFDSGSSWILIKDNVHTTYLSWDINSFPSGSEYIIKIVATCSDGLSTFDISDEPFYILEASRSSTTRTPSFPFGLIIITLVVLIGKKREFFKR